MYSSRIWALPAEHKVPRLRKMIRFAHHFASLGMTIQEEHFTTFRYLSVTSDHAIHKHLSLQMHGGLGLFEASGSLLHLGIPYFGLISWQPSSQKTPPSADSGVGMGEFTAISRSASITCSTSAISDSFSFGVSHFFSFTK